MRHRPCPAGLHHRNPSPRRFATSRTALDLDDELVAAAMRLYGTRTKAAAVRAAMEDAVKR
ncbi:MAG: type II toxin-antitoxin system VapB family antitoxin, partial [Streptomycetaceae bacterium]|nr:type II toxin-antitoxin system VapB family antitoxin [Streptomycetaceae bacterium]